MIFYSANILLSSLVMQIVFYHLPTKFNLIAFSRFGVEKVTADGIRVTKSLVKIEEDLDEMIKCDEEAREFDMKKKNEIKVDCGNNFTSVNKRPLVPLSKKASGLQASIKEDKPSEERIEQIKQASSNSFHSGSVVNEELTLDFDEDRLNSSQSMKLNQPAQKKDGSSIKVKRKTSSNRKKEKMESYLDDNDEFNDMYENNNSDEKLA